MTNDLTILPTVQRNHVAERHEVLEFLSRLTFLTFQRDITSAMDATKKIGVHVDFEI